MDSQVGTILRQARNRREVELAEVEAATRIRQRYLRAIESEEWDVLPGGVYTRGFIRTYASFLGLDGDRLADDYRTSVEGTPPAVDAGAPSPARPRPGSAGRPRRPRWAWRIAAGVSLLVAALVVAALPGGGGGTGGGSQIGRREGRSSTPGSPKTAPQAKQSSVSLHLDASAEVWVCLLDASGRPLVDGRILEAGAEAGPFRSGSFTVSFGNGEVSMMVDGSEAEIPATSSPVGYSIGHGGSLTELSEAERPTCT
jgi:hypothetical protein